MKIITLDNSECLRPLAEEWLKEVNNEFGIDINVDAHLKDIQCYIDNPNSDVLGMIKDDKVVGYMGLCCMKNPLGNGMVANEHLWYVHPEHRGIGGMRLLGAAMNWAKEKGCTHFIGNASRLASDMHEKVCKLYEKVGMLHFESSYICQII